MNKLTDEQIDAALGAAYTRLFAETGYNGGMGGETWDKAAARAIESEVVLRLNGIGEQSAPPAVPDGWMRDEAQVRGLLEHLTNAGWVQTESGPDCVDQGSAMAAEVIERVLLPMLSAAPKDGEK